MRTKFEVKIGVKSDFQARALQVSGPLTSYDFAQGPNFCMLDHQQRKLITFLCAIVLSCRFISQIVRSYHYHRHALLCTHQILVRQTNHGLKCVKDALCLFFLDSKLCTCFTNDVRCVESNDQSVNQEMEQFATLI